MCRLAGVGLMEAGLGASAPRRSVCLVDALLHVSSILLSDPSGIDKHALHVVLEEPQEENAKMRKTMSHCNFYLILLAKASHIDQTSSQGVKQITQ